MKNKIKNFLFWFLKSVVLIFHLKRSKRNLESYDCQVKIERYKQDEKIQKYVQRNTTALEIYLFLVIKIV